MQIIIINLLFIYLFIIINRKNNENLVPSKIIWGGEDMFSDRLITRVSLF